MSTSNDSSKAELNIQIHSPVRRNESTKERLFGRQSSFSSDRLDLTSNDVSFAAGKNTWWIWGGSKYSGVLCMVISSVAYSFMGLFVKLLSGRSMLHTVQPINFLSNVMLTIIKTCSLNLHILK